MKPANVLIDRYGRPFLADFNVSTRSSEEAHDPNHIGGTLLYMAPEHLEAFCEETPVTPVDERSDIYSLGLVLWEMLVGKLPFKNVDRCSTVREFVRKSAEVRSQSGRNCPRRAASRGRWSVFFAVASNRCRRSAIPPRATWAALWTAAGSCGTWRSTCRRRGR